MNVTFEKVWCDGDHQWSIWVNGEHVGYVTERGPFKMMVQLTGKEEFRAPTLKMVEQEVSLRLIPMDPRRHL